MNTDFACDCSPEEQAKMRSLRAWARMRLGKPRHFLTALVHELVATHEVGEIRIYTDQWSLVSATVKGESVGVQCDLVEDGLAMLLKKLDEQAKK